jgi:GWxTD domain-containing protein
MIKKFLLGMILIVAVPLWAMDYDVDYAVFRGSEGYDIIEVYYLLPRQMFKFQPAENLYRSHVFIRTALVQQDSVIDLAEREFIDQVKNMQEVTADQKIPEIAVLQAKPGSYQLMTIVADMTSREQYKQSFKVELPDYGNQRLAISHIHLSGQISKTQKQNQFSKYFGYDIIPNASTVFNESYQVLYAFFEIYNLQFDQANPGDYKVRYAVTDLNGKELQSQDWIARKKPGSSAVEIDQVVITNLPAGVFELRVEVKDEASNQSISAVKRFRLTRTVRQPQVAAQTMQDLQLENLGEKDLDEIFGPLKYIAKNVEIKRYNKSDLAGKRQIIAHFWDERDRDKSTLINESKIEFENRLAYVNQQFSTPRMKGWRTDFGRVYLLYGPPNEIERHPSSLERKPYQIWHYHEIEGGVIFVFVDKSGFGQFELVHSTARSELQDADWMRWVDPNATRSSSSSNIDW